MEILSAKNKNLKHYGDRIDLDNNSQSISDKKNYSISLRINTLLYDTLHHYLLAMHNVSDYKFSSISDVLRHIIAQIAEKFPLEGISFLRIVPNETHIPTSRPLEEATLVSTQKIFNKSKEFFYANP